MVTNGGVQPQGEAAMRTTSSEEAIATMRLHFARSHADLSFQRLALFAPLVLGLLALAPTAPNSASVAVLIFVPSPEVALPRALLPCPASFPIRPWFCATCLLHTMEEVFALFPSYIGRRIVSRL